MNFTGLLLVLALTVPSFAATTPSEIAPSQDQAAYSVLVVDKIWDLEDQKLDSSVRVTMVGDGGAAAPFRLVVGIPDNGPTCWRLSQTAYELPDRFSNVTSVKLSGTDIVIKGSIPDFESETQSEKAVTVRVTYKDASGKVLKNLIVK